MTAFLRNSAFLLLLAAPTLIHSGNLRSATGQCKTGDTVFFSCEVERGKQVTLCGLIQEGSITRRQYFFGRKNRPELVYPAPGESSRFTASNYHRPQVEYNEVHFRSNGVEYSVFKRYDSIMRSLPSFGVEVRTSGGREKQFICNKGTVKDRLAEFMEELPCDSSSAFGCLP